MNARTSRRRFVGQTAQILGILGWAGRNQVWGQTASDPNTGWDRAELGCGFDRARRRFSAAEAGCQGRMVDPARAGRDGTGGDGAACAPARLRPASRSVSKALAYLEGFIGPKGGLSEAPHANYSTSIALVAFQQANANGRYDRIIKAGQKFLTTMQWDESEGKTARRRVLWRCWLRRLEQPPGSVEYGVLHRSLARFGIAARRSEPEESAFVCLPVPEFEEASSTTRSGLARSMTADSFTRPPMAANRCRAKRLTGV